MAIPRMFESNTPFIIVTGESELSFLGKDDSQVCEEEKDSLVQAIAPHLNRVMQHGTAKHVGPRALEEIPPVSIVAQAEREDFQEFSPTPNTQLPYLRSQLLRKHRPLAKGTMPQSDTDDDEDLAVRPYHLQRKQRRKSRAKMCTEEGQERPIIQGLWVQEIDWLRSASREMSSCDIIPPPPQFTDSYNGDLSLTCVQEGVSSLRCSCEEVCACAEKCEAASLSEDQHGLIDTSDTCSSESREDSDSDCDLEQDSESNPESDSDSSCCVEDCCQRLCNDKMSDSTFDLMGVSGFSRDDFDSLSGCEIITNPSDSFSRAAGCAQSLLGMSDHTYNPYSVNFILADVRKIDTVLDELRGRVTHTPKIFASSFFEDGMKQTFHDKNTKNIVNEGLLFHNALQPRSFKYREGMEYCILQHIQNGSYGDVFSIRDKRTGFTCGAKRIPLSRFSSREVSTWSAQNSPRIVELFGAVREGPHVVLFMDLKPGCLSQLLKEMSALPEDLALHYLHQTLEALEHLHSKKVLHLDVKVDNVLLSADCTDTFLCDFGLSQTLDDNGWSTKAFRGSAFAGTETHMAPEVAKGDRLCAKADVWSSCCMLLHMLNGFQPWIRYYSHPLCLQIVNEPPPLWEVPSNCNNFTAKVFRAGLKKDPDKRASAKELRRKTTKALRAVGGLSPWSVKSACEKLYPSKKQYNDTPSSLLPEISITSKRPTAPILSPTMHWVSPWRTIAGDEDSNGSEWDSASEEDSDVETDLITREWECQPKSLRDNNLDDIIWETGSFSSEVDIYMGEEEYTEEKQLSYDRDYKGGWEEDGDVEEEDDEERESSDVSTEHFHALRDVFPLLRKGHQTHYNLWGSEAELECLRDGISLGNPIHLPSPEPRDDPPSCFSCSDSSQIDASDNDTDHSSDDLSSGVFSSCNSQADGHLEWTASPHQPSSYCFEGVDVWIENVQGQCLRIREQRQVKVGHVAIGISDQISEKAFTLETLDRKFISFEQEIKASGLWLRCVPAPDRCQRWSWRVKDGKLELRE